MRVPFADLELLNREVRHELLEAAYRVMNSNSLILGPEVEKFQASWARYCGKQHCVGVGNGTDAIALMLRAYGIGPGDQVVVPANTYIATWMGVSMTGATPLPVDASLTTMLMDAAHAEMRISCHPKVKAILAVHLYGSAQNFAELRSVADRFGLPLLVDAAQAHGLKGALLGDAAAFSFYPTKNLGAIGDAGAVVTDCAYVAERVAALRNYGALSKNVHARIGVNSRLDEMQAAFLNVKLPKLDEWNARRKANAELYDDLLAPLTGEGFLRPPLLFKTVWHQYVINSTEVDRDGLRLSLQVREIDTLVHYPTPPYLQEAYVDLPYEQGDFPKTEMLAGDILSLPIGPEITGEQIRQVAQAITSEVIFRQEAA